MVARIGLLGRGGEELVPCAWEIYQSWERHSSSSDPLCSVNRLADDFKDSFSCHSPLVHFLGLWDSIDSVGLFRNKVFPQASRCDAVSHVRHALSIDERRSNFRQSSSSQSQGYWFPVEGEQENDLVERWFPGNHGDIGGGWPAESSDGGQLADLSLRWMIHEAHLLGLPFSLNALCGLSMCSPVSALMARAHDLLSFRRDQGKGKYSSVKWWTLELIPWPYKIGWQRKIFPNLGRRRKIPQDATLHWSVKWKRALDPRYRPRNIPAGAVYDASDELVCIPDEAVCVPDDMDDLAGNSEGSV